MPIGHRRLAFSGKAKKQQMREKKKRKQLKQEGNVENSLIVSSPKNEKIYVMSLNQQPKANMSDKNSPNRYNLKFHHETQAELQQRKEEGGQTLKIVSSKESLEIDIDSCFPTELDFPIPWDFNMSKEELEGREKKKIYNWKMPSFRDVYKLYCSMNHGTTIRDLCFRHKLAQLNIDEHTLVQYGCLKGLIRRLHKYPVTLAESDEAVYSKYNGLSSMDEICCSLKISNSQLEAILEKDLDVITDL